MRRSPQKQERPEQQPSYNKELVKPYSQSRPPIQPRSPEFKDSPIINSHTYNKDRSMLDTRNEELEARNQPDAFGSSSSPESFANKELGTTQPKK